MGAPPERAATPGRYARRRLRTPVPHGTHQLTITIATGPPPAAAAAAAAAAATSLSPTTPVAAGPPAGSPTGAAATVGGPSTPSVGRQRSKPPARREPEQPTWVRVEAEHLAAGAGARPAGRAPVPELARTLLTLIDATDGTAAIEPLPRLVTPAEVDALIDELCDPDRSLPTVVASVPPAAQLDTWLAGVVHPLMRHLTGLAALYVLDHAALPHFNVALEYHKVYGGAVRTYLPEIDPASRADSSRHPVMPRHRIEDDVRRAAALIAREPRRAAAELPLPPLLAAVPVLQPPPESKRRPQPALSDPAAPSEPSEPSGSAAQSGHSDRPGQVGRSDAAGQTVQLPGPRSDRALPSVAEPGTDSLAAAHTQSTVLSDSSGPGEQGAQGELTDHLGRADQAERQVRADELQRIKRSLLLARRREQRLRAESAEQHAALRAINAQVRSLTDQLRAMTGVEAADLLRFTTDPLTSGAFGGGAPALGGFAAEAYGAEPLGGELFGLEGFGPDGFGGLAADGVEQDDDAPASFGDLVGRFDEFPLLEFTGDQKEALALDGQYAGTGWAKLTWEGLTALQEYASAAVRGEAHGDFKQWCEHTPPGCHRFPPRKAVRGESRTVESHTKWKRERMLPVPACVDSSRRAFMGAHLRIGGGRTAPRLHYLDDCSGSGRIYVGYIGLHLTNTRTN
ncbi:hypothetical protein [Kitasatospora sp. MMS16-BH015]|uniref:hypothetical protein n=1 Tax=Kitasatospora sp. MMS16-BH015 TaxID=2018025 RepID=UPI00131A5E2F|nr:hypothetical protein [Kitasatospora sp. MMS16-BH015]